MTGAITAGIDVGGTFTDIVLHDPVLGSLTSWKVPTDPDDPVAGVVSGLVEACAAAGRSPADLARVHHGTTVATNAMLENAGGPVGLITTEGFRDVLHIGRHQRPLNYSVLQDIPWQARPLVRRRDRLTVAERIVPPDGEVLVPLDEDAVRRAALTLAARGIRSIVIGFLFAYLNPVHERRAREIVLDAVPDALVSLSHEVSGQFREFERFTTAAVNGFVAPKVGGYVAGLAARLGDAGIRADLSIMTSSGSSAPPARVVAAPALTLLSGPAAGVIGATAAGLAAGRANLVTFDMGGTSADIGVVVDGAVREAGTRDVSIAGFPLQLAMIDIETIGAGGGSIAYEDVSGAFRVGPRSAGSRPGPAAYGRGGTEPTVTDAHVVLGRLPADRFLGGRMGLDAEAARAAVGRLAARLGLGVEETAAGILRVVNASMAEAIRSRTVRRGIDPRGFALVAFGGAGPLHAAELAAALDIPEVVLPPLPGVTSAVGLVGARTRYEHVRTAFLRDDRPGDEAKLREGLAALAAAVMADFAREGRQPAEVDLSLSADVRYLGQGYELRVPVHGAEDPLLSAIAERFAAAHLADYGRDLPGRTVEVVNLRATGLERAGTELPRVHHAAADGPAEVGRGSCTFVGATGAQTADTPFLVRGSLRPGATVTGPAILLQDDTTVVVPPRARATAHASGALVISLEAAP